MRATLTVPFDTVLDWLRWDVEHNGIDDWNTLREVVESLEAMIEAIELADDNDSRDIEIGDADLACVECWVRELLKERGGDFRSPISDSMHATMTKFCDELLAALAIDDRALPAADTVH
jgi:hypothetical protein